MKDEFRSSRIDYLDFDLEVGAGQGREYPLTVLRSPAGEARAVMRFPFDTLALASHLKDLQIALLRSGGRARRLPSREEQIVQQFGQHLVEALLIGDVRTRYEVSMREAQVQGRRLRIRLRFQDSPELVSLAALPWEFAYDIRQGEYICLSKSASIVRYLELPEPVSTLSVQPPLRILGMVASPRDLPPLDVLREQQRVEAALATLRHDRLVELTWLPGQTWRDLQRAMRGGPWHIFHFIGHGGFDHNVDEGLIALSDDDGRRCDLRATDLGRLLRDHRTLRFALLNACEGARGGEHDLVSSTAAVLVRSGIPAVLAMQYEITDQAAIEFSRSFYEALADGLPVDAAVTEARVAVSLGVNNSLEWGTPVLFTRCASGMIFQLDGPLPAENGLDRADVDRRRLQERLANVYSQGLQHFAVRQWKAAAECLAEIQRLQPGYRDAGELLVRAQEALAGELHNTSDAPGFYTLEKSQSRSKQQETVDTEEPNTGNRGTPWAASLWSQFRRLPAWVQVLLWLLLNVLVFLLYIWSSSVPRAWKGTITIATIIIYFIMLQRFA